MASYKERARQAFLEKVHEKDLCDSRDVAFGANVDSLPNGAFGMVLLSLKGSDLIISDLDIRSNIGPVICTIPLKQVRDFKISRRLVGHRLTFTYDGHRFLFENILGLKPLLEIIASEVG